MPMPAPRLLILIPSDNTGRILRETIIAAMAQELPLRVVMDGSTDGSPETIRDLVQPSSERLHILHLPQLVRRGTCRNGASEFRHHDAREGLRAHSGNVSILDILQFFNPEQQSRLRISPPGG